jgi:hypothetical protein
MGKVEHVGALVQKWTLVRSKELKGLSVSVRISGISLKPARSSAWVAVCTAQKKPQSPSMRPSSK